MEKRLLLAFVLSFGVLYAWSLYFAPKPAVNTQVIDSKQLVSEATVSKIESTVESAKDLTKKEIKETPEILENDSFFLEFSNKGGYLKSVKLKNYDQHFPVSKIVFLKKYADTAFALKEKTKSSIIYLYEDAEISITKTYSIKAPELIESSIQVVNKSSKPQTVNVDTNALSLEMSNLKIDSYDKTYLEYVVYSGQNYIRKSHAFEFAEKENKAALGIADWAAFRNRYFCLIVKPDYQTMGYALNTSDRSSLDILLQTKGVELAPGNSVGFDYKIYAGPEIASILNSYDKNFSKIKMFYRFGLFDIVSKFLYHALHVVHNVVKNWGLSIILICVGIYAVMYPLTLSSMTSMKKMQALQPKIKELQEKNKNNQQKQSMELMQLYKDNKINPLGGCLPLLLQMPFFIGIYQVLWRDVSFKGAHFLWIKDLTLPDKLFTLPFNIPFLGNEFNILPIGYAVAMFFQQKFSAKTMVSSDPSQAEVQRMMVIFMPIMLGLLFYKFPSGITLYFTTYFLMTAFVQWKMSKV